MKHLVDQTKPVPFTCQDCIHIDADNPFRCKALLPDEQRGSAAEGAWAGSDLVERDPRH